MTSHELATTLLNLPDAAIGVGFLGISHYLNGVSEVKVGTLGKSPLVILDLEEETINNEEEEVELCK